MLNAKLAELEAGRDEKQFEDTKEELSSRLAEVHTRLSDMDAASGPARAAALLAGDPTQCTAIEMTEVLFHRPWL